MQKWYDQYDWNPGSTVLVPGYGNVSDDDALVLKNAHIGHDYKLQADWIQHANGTVDIGWIFDTINLEWTGP
jgi:hypothetical protein